MKAVNTRLKDLFSDTYRSQTSKHIFAGVIELGELPVFFRALRSARQERGTRVGQGEEGKITYLFPSSHLRLALHACVSRFARLRRKWPSRLNNALIQDSVKQATKWNRN